jgi:hypothetical protein
MRIHCANLKGAAVLTVLLASVSRAQVPGAPVLQNAFVNPGLAFAANVGGQGYFGLAAAWGLSGGKLQVSGAAGAQRARGATRGAYGGRAAYAVWSSASGAFGGAAFAGFGGAPSKSVNGLVTNPAITSVPAGVSVAYRRAIGSRGISAHLAPFYAWTRADSGGTTVSSSAFRISGGLDFAVTQSIGVTVGAETGAGKSGSSGRGGIFGAAITFVPGRR